MDRWRNLFEQYGVEDKLNTLQALLPTTEEIASSQGEDAIGEFIRIDSFCRALQLALDTTDPYLVHPNHVKVLGEKLSQVIQQIQAYNEGKASGQIQGAANEITNLIGPLKNLPAIKGSDEIEGLRETIATFRRSAGQYISRLDQAVESLREKTGHANEAVESLKQDIENQTGRVDSAIQSYEEQFRNSQDQREKRFEDATEDRRQRFQQELEEYEKERKEAVQDIANRSEKFFSEAMNEAKGKVATIEGYREDAEDLVGIITDTGTVGNYQRIANKAGRTKGLWQMVVVIALLGLIGTAFWIFAQADGADDFSWGLLSTRILLVIGCLSIAGYAGRQASQLNMVEQKNRSRELALSSVDPYLSNLEEEERRRIKAYLALVFFDVTENKGSSEESSALRERIIERVTKGDESTTQS